MTHRREIAAPWNKEHGLAALWYILGTANLQGRNMSSRPTGGKRQTKMRGPSRPIDPRNAPGPNTQRRGIDTFGLALLGIISAVILGMVFLLAGQQQPTASVPTDPQSNPQQPGTGTVQYVQASEARTLVESGSAQVIDVRPAPNYEAMH